MKEVLVIILGFNSSWQSVAGQLLASVVLLLSGYQDLGLRSRMGAAFGFFVAVAFGISALFTAIRANLWSAVAVCVVVFCFETWVMLRWWSKPIRSR
jgi:hypothetical protein